MQTLFLHSNQLITIQMLRQARPVLQAHRWRVLLVGAMTSLLFTNWLLAMPVHACYVIICRDNVF